MDRAKREAIREVLASIASENAGRLTADRVVEVATDPTNPLHDQFEWDDSTAAREHRLAQARALIRSVRVIVETDSKTLSAVYYVRDPAADSREQGYVPTLSLRSDSALALEALRAELVRASSAMKRAHEIATAVGLADDVERIQRDLDVLRSHAVSMEEAA